MTSIRPTTSPAVCVPSTPAATPPGPTGQVKVGNDTYDVRNGDVFVSGKNVGKIDDAGNFEVNGQKGNVANVAGATWNGTLSDGTRADNRPSGLVQAGGDTFAVQRGEVSLGGARVGTLADNGSFSVRLNGRTITGNVGADPALRYAGTTSDGTPVSNLRLAPGGGGLVTCAGPGGVIAPATSGFASRSGADLALSAQRFFEVNQYKPEYQAATWTHAGAPNAELASQVKHDALRYLENDAALSAAATRMIDSFGGAIHPAKVDGLKVDLALAHYAQEGRAAGRSWGTSGAAVNAMLDAPRAAPAWAKGEATNGPLFVVGTNGRSGATVAAPVSGSATTVLVADGRGNTIDFCTTPAPSPTGIGDAVLGGTKNRGQLDLMGTILVRAGDANAWTVKDPSARVKGDSEYGAAVKSQLAANALNSNLVLEGTSADWSVRVSADTATYENVKTGTSVTIPAEHQARIAYLSGESFERLAVETSIGKSVPTRRTDEVRDATAGAVQSPATAPSPATSEAATTPEVGETDQGDHAQLEKVLTELLAEAVSQNVLASLFEALAKATSRGGRGHALRALLMKEAGLTWKQANQVLEALGFKASEPLTARALQPTFTP